MRGCLSECCLRTSSAAPSIQGDDEGMSVFFADTSDRGKLKSTRLKTMNPGMRRNDGNPCIKRGTYAERLSLEIKAYAEWL